MSILLRTSAPILRWGKKSIFDFSVLTNYPKGVARERLQGTIVKDEVKNIKIREVSGEGKYFLVVSNKNTLCIPGRGLSFAARIKVEECESNENARYLFNRQIGDIGSRMGVKHTAILEFFVPSDVHTFVVDVQLTSKIKPGLNWGVDFFIHLVKDEEPETFILGSDAKLLEEFEIIDKEQVERDIKKLEDTLFTLKDICSIAKDKTQLAVKISGLELSVELSPTLKEQEVPKEDVSLICNAVDEILRKIIDSEVSIANVLGWYLKKISFAARGDEPTGPQPIWVNISDLGAFSVISDCVEKSITILFHEPGADIPENSTPESNYAEKLEKNLLDHISAMINWVLKDDSTKLNLPEPKEKQDYPNLELLTSEVTYNERLKQLIELFYKPLDEVLQREHRGEMPVVEMEDLRSVFNSIGAVLEVSELIKGAMLKGIKDAGEWSKYISVVAIAEYRMYLGAIYTTYSSNYARAVRSLKRMQEVKNFDIFERKRQDLIGLDLESLLVMPVQRMVRYELLILSIMKSIKKESTPEGAKLSKRLSETLHVVRTMNEKINEEVRSKDIISLMAGVISKLQMKGPLSEAHRIIVRDGLEEMYRFQMVGPRNIRIPNTQILLLSDMIVIAKERGPLHRGKHWIEQERFSLGSISIAKKSPNRANGFVISCPNDEEFEFLMQRERLDSAPNVESWIEDINRTITIENRRSLKVSRAALPAFSSPADVKKSALSRQQIRATL